MKSIQKEKKDYSDIIILCIGALAVLAFMWTFTGKWPWTNNPYNSYMLQTRSWLEGRLDLGQNYPYLELAIFNDKYFVSFPPFPSYVMLPFALLRWYNCDGIITTAFSIAAVVYAYKLLEHFEIKKGRAMFFALFLTVGSNWLFTAQTAWVWFIAQNMAFTLSLMALYYAVKGKTGLSLAFWACAVGCRPLQFLYLPVILYIVYNQCRQESFKATILYIVKNKWTGAIPMAVIALSYMLLNFARFGNPLEFGHNYLPEFMRVSTGQFNASYIKENLPKLLRLPKITFKGAWEYQSADGTCMLLISPIFISYIVYLVRSLIKKENPDIKLSIIILAVALLELILTTAHKTMGGSHFGNRYTNDVLPVIFLGLIMLIKQKGRWERLNHILFFIGITVNIIGAVTYFTA
ncbi:MAG: hypothetical protein ACI38A_03010 [Candidatus Ornithomonoglobus sp.]